MSATTPFTPRIAELNERYIACPHCDAIWPRPQLAPRQFATCGRCHAELLRRQPHGTERTIALMLAALILYLVSITFPFMSVDKYGLGNRISIVDAVTTLWGNGMQFLAIACAAFIIVFPLLRITLLLGLSVRFAIERMGRRRRLGNARTTARLFRLALELEPWTMVEIFMIGVTVSLVKVGGLAKVSLGPAFWAMAAMVIIMTMGASALDKDAIWRHIRREL
ncbi:MAG: paraquat-inducible membrane protein A [Gammaproteobacteria bacterium]|nr:MAG: paraquat-inducible membrane protein A [Gammaproteobacteria bacterium]